MLIPDHENRFTVRRALALIAVYGFLVLLGMLA